MPISLVRSRTDINMMFMITIPPTTIPMATMAGTTANSTCVNCFQKRDQGVGRLDREIVFLARAPVSAQSASLRGRAHRRVDVGGVVDLDRDRGRLSPPVQRLIGRDRRSANPSKDWPRTRPFGR